MLDDMKKKGKPVTPKVEEMALWLDSLDTSSLDDGQVTCFSSLLSALLVLSCLRAMMTAVLSHAHASSRLSMPISKCSQVMYRHNEGELN